MKKKIFNFIGSFLEQTPIPTKFKLRINFITEFILFFISGINNRIQRNITEQRIAEDFIKYYITNNIENKSIKLIKLKKNLSKDSIEIIDNVIKRYIHIYSNNSYSSKLFTDDELVKQKINIFPIKRKYLGFGNYFGIENFYYHSGLTYVNKKLLSKYKNRDVIDAGAANGDTALIFSQIYKFNQTYAFEPELNNYIQMVKNIKKFNLCNVVPVQIGLGNSTKSLNITNESGQSHISTDGSQAIKMTTIDAFVNKNKLKVGLIKMDIEGYEYKAVLGAIKTIKHFQPILLISIYHTGKDFFEIKPLIEKLGNYKFTIKKLNPYHYFFDTMLICEPIIQ